MNEKQRLGKNFFSRRGENELIARKGQLLRSEKKINCIFIDWKR